MSVHQGYADVGALRMYYELHGEARPGRPPLLLIHGSGSTIESNFGELIPLLTGTRQVVGVEEQGHGHTEGTDRPFTFENKDVDRELNPDPRHLEQLFKLDAERTKGFQDLPDSALQAISSPTLVLIGDQDIVIPEHAAAMARAIPDARLTVVPGNHGNYLGEIAASDGDTSLMRATVPLLLRFLDT